MSLSCAEMTGIEEYSVEQKNVLQVEINGRKTCRLCIHLRSTHTTATYDLFIYLFGVLRRFQHCTGHITTGSWKGRGNQYIQLVKVLYYKLPTNSKQLPAFPLEAMLGTRIPASEVGGEIVTTLPQWPHCDL